MTPESIQPKYAQMVASTWITPGGQQFFEERKTFSHGLGHSRWGQAGSRPSHVRYAAEAEARSDH
jgi:hypothetical protein